MVNNIRISLAIARNRKRRILLLKRPKDAHAGGLWSFPGGKVEADEKPLKAAQRELYEETRLMGESWYILGTTRHAYSDQPFCFHLFSCHVEDTSGMCSDDPHVWVDQDCLKDYPMPEANARFLEIICL